MNKRIIYGGMGIIIILLVALLFTVSGKETPRAATETPVTVTESKPKTMSSFLGLKEEPDVLEDIISVNNPFDTVDSQGMTLSTSTKNPFTNLVATMEYDMVNAVPTTKDGNFSETLMANTDVTSDEDVSIVHRLKYEQDSVFAWTQAVGDNFSWNQDPSRVAVPFGSEVTITYSTSDASGVWVGDINIDKPQ